MKKTACILCVIALLAMPFTSYAQVQEDESLRIELKYVAARSITEYFKHIGNGQFELEASLYPKASDLIDKVTINVVVKSPSRKICYNETFITTRDKLRNTFSAGDKFTVTSKGTYQMNITYKCYKNNKLVESIVSTPKIATY